MALNIYLIVVYNQRYRNCFRRPWCNSRALDNRPDRLGIESVELEKLFLFAFETNGRNFGSTVVFFKNPNAKQKYIFEYLC